MRSLSKSLMAGVLMLGACSAHTRAWAKSGIADSSPGPLPQQSLHATSSELAFNGRRGTNAIQQLQTFQSSEVKFDLTTLMDTLKDHRHEGWVLSAYPDPKTHLPLIGAGFSLDLPEREHLQQDPLNPHTFLEPSSAELWQAAGLNLDTLQAILYRYNNPPLKPATRKSRRKKRASLPPEISNEEATQLLRVAIIQAIYNAKAYTRVFDSLTASQQMAMTQLVYQMGVNLEQFSQFLHLINDDAAAILTFGPGVYDADHWDAAQAALIQSQWARLYRSRAISVIAMFDPIYLHDPGMAEVRVSAALPTEVLAPRSDEPATRTETNDRKRLAHVHRKRSARSSRKI